MYLEEFAERWTSPAVTTSSQPSLRITGSRSPRATCGPTCERTPRTSAGAADASGRSRRPTPRRCTASSGTPLDQQGQAARPQARGPDRAFSTKTLSNAAVAPDVFGNAYEYLIKRFADQSNKKAGEYYTPRSVVGLLVNILDPSEGETVYDPACGTGGMLIEVIEHVKCAGGSPRRYGASSTARRRSSPLRHRPHEPAAARHRGLQDCRGDTLRDRRSHRQRTWPDSTA